jgi:2-oxoglutarate/2-oxoacid ferredoxin oxidoreductase subunit beta
MENQTIDTGLLQLTKEDFSSDQMVKWCPGCGDHAILHAVEGVFPKLGVAKEDFVVVSGIGCSSRFPYYMNTYGMHGIHGRAAALATGVKLSNPKLSVWMITGDGDCMAIGGNHFIHTIRRNIDINILLFNNKIYGLTKGQYSPTTPRGTKTKTSPQGTFERPFNPGELVIGAQGNFFARGLDTNPKQLAVIFEEAARHKGTSVVEVMQNCVIFYNKAHELITARETRDDYQLHLVHGKPLIFGKNNDKGIVLKGTRLELVTIGENGITEKDLLVHDQFEQDPGVHVMIARMAPPQFPAAFGIIRSVAAETFESVMENTVKEAKANATSKNTDEMLRSANTWTID